MCWSSCLCSTVDIIWVFLHVVFIPFMSRIIQFKSVSFTFTSLLQIITGTVVLHVTQRITEIWIMSSYQVIHETFATERLFSSKLQTTTLDWKIYSQPLQCNCSSLDCYFAYATTLQDSFWQISSKLNVTYHLKHKTSSMKVNYIWQFQEFITAKIGAECVSTFKNV